MAYITGRFDVRNGTFCVHNIRPITGNGTYVGSTVINGTELSYLAGVTSDVQTQLNAKQATITGAATTIDTEDLSANYALVSTAGGKVGVSGVSTTQLGYLDATSSVQTQIDTKAAATGYTASRLIQSNANGTIVVSTLSITANGTINGSSATPGMTSTTTLLFFPRGNGFENKRILQAGENLVAGNICRLKAGKYWKTDSDNATQVSGQLAYCNATITANATGEFYWPPCTIVGTGFPNGSLAYLGPTAGGMVGTAPGTGKQVRLIGDTNGTTIFNFSPSANWMEMA